MPITVIVPQAPSVINRTLITSTAYTTSDNTTQFPIDFFTSADITVAVTVCSGTLDVYVQKLLPDNSTWMDIAHFAQWTTAVFTTTGTYSLAFVNGGNTIRQQTDASLAANTVITTNFGSFWRIKFAIGGASGTSTFGVFGNFSA